MFSESGYGHEFEPEPEDSPKSPPTKLGVLTAVWVFAAAVIALVLGFGAGVVFIGGSALVACAITGKLEQARMDLAGLFKKEDRG